jgi:uncharacterized protein YndB with AHSA1/START domain
MSESHRGYAQVVGIAARPTAVWRAFTEPPVLVRWYAAEARVEPLLGGKFWVRLRDGRERTAVIDVWEVGRRLRLVHFPPANLPANPDGGPLTEDVLFDIRPGRTVVRVLGANVPSVTEWDAEYLHLRMGWAYWLHQLKKLLEAPAELAG